MKSTLTLPTNREWIMYQRAIKLFAISCLILFLLSCHQERMVFHAESLPQDYQFEFEDPFEEVFIPIDEEVKINGLLFQAENPKGLVFYLHGNAGTLKGWGEISTHYLKNGYDFFIIDYRSFGKSTGTIDKEKDMYNDIQVVYDSLQTQFNYKEQDIVVIGYSIGTGFAAKLSSENSPKQLILNAPYYSIPNLVNQSTLIIPHFLFKYKLPTNKYLKNVKAPVTIFHGDKDKLIPLKSSIKLKKHFKTIDTLFVLPETGHHGFSKNEIYQQEVAKILK